MQSDRALPDLGRLLAAPRERFRSALAAAVEQVRGALAAERNAGDAATRAEELGRFATGRIDSSRFAALLDRRRTLDATALQRIAAAYETLTELSGRGDALFEAHVEPGQSLRDTVADALAQAGRAFGAARVYELSRSGHYREEEHGPFLTAFPYARWSRSERQLAPPLVVYVNGRDARADGLAEFLDGVTKLVLVVRGEAPLAPLVRLVTPGVFVLQTADATDLDRFAAHAGPAVAAIVPETCALFVHDPARGDQPSERMEVRGVPEAAPPPMMGGRSAAQQREELRLLESYRAPRAPAAAPVGAAQAGAPAEPVDRLAAWLLAHAELKDV